MPIGTDPNAAGDGDADADADADTDGGYICVDWHDEDPAQNCRVTIPPEDDRHPAPDLTAETLGTPIAADAALHTTSWTWTALETDRDGRLYAFYWWVPAEELDDPEVDAVHLAWRTRAPGADQWSEVHAVSGVTGPEILEAICDPTPSATDPVQFVATDDGYVHAFWRKTASCRSGDTHFVDHVMFEDGELVYREPMPIECPNGTRLAMTDALAVPNGGVMVGFLCGSGGRIQTFSCGCWSEMTLVGGDDNADGSATFLAIQDDLQLVNVGPAGDSEPWIVIRDFDDDLWARRLADPALPESYLQISDEENAVGSPVPIADESGGLWVAWQAESSPSQDVRVAAMVDGAFEAPVSLPGGATPAEPQDGVDYSGVLSIDGEWVRGVGPVVLSEETVTTSGTPNVVEDDFFVRTWADGAWSEPLLAATNQATFAGSIGRHTASDLGRMGETPALAYVTYVGDEGTTHFELRVTAIEEGP
jgi:hypothetical protein